MGWIRKTRWDKEERSSALKPLGEILLWLMEKNEDQMNTRKGLGHNCSSCYLSLSSSLTRSPSNYINHTHRHTALGDGLFVFCLDLFFFLHSVLHQTNSIYNLGS